MFLASTCKRQTIDIIVPCGKTEPTVRTGEALSLVVSTWSESTLDASESIHEMRRLGSIVSNKYLHVRLLLRAFPLLARDHLKNDTNDVPLSEDSHGINPKTHFRADILEDC